MGIKEEIRRGCYSKGKKILFGARVVVRRVESVIHVGGQNFPGHINGLS